MADYIDLKNLTLEELTGVVNIYPWFGAARVEFCRRMAENSWTREQYSDFAMYVASRRIISDIERSAKESDLTDTDVSKLMKAYLEPQAEPVEAGDRDGDKEYRREVRIIGGDWFSRDDYESVKGKDDSHVFSRFAAQARSEMSKEQIQEQDDFFCTETLAQIYVDQGYYDMAIRIYSKLILANPEKNAYFAALIDKLKNEIKN